MRHSIAQRISNQSFKLNILKNLFRLPGTFSSEGMVMKAWAEAKKN
jgi:hypothetical protein